MLRRGVASNGVTTSINNNNTSSFQSPSRLIGVSSSCGENDLNSTSAVALMTSSSLQMLSTNTPSTAPTTSTGQQSTKKTPQTDELSSTSSSSSSSSSSNYHHPVSCRTPKLFLKKQDKNKKIISNNNNNNNNKLNNQEKSSGERKVVVVDSIRFERKTLYSKQDQTPIVVSSNPTTTTGWSIDDFYGTKHRNWRPPHSSWGRKPAQGSPGSPFLTSTNQTPHRAPLRCLLDSGLDECQPDRTDSGEFQAFVVAESHHRKSRDEAADGHDDVFTSLFERNRTSEEFHVRQREAYMRFRSGAAGRTGGMGTVVKSTSFRPTTTTATPPNLIMINSKT